MFGVCEPFCQYINSSRSQMTKLELYVQLTISSTSTPKMHSLRQVYTWRSFKLISPQSEHPSSFYVQNYIKTYAENLDSSPLLNSSSTSPQPLIPFHCIFWTSWPVISKIENVLFSSPTIPLLSAALYFPTVLSCSNFFLFPTLLVSQT